VVDFDRERLLAGVLIDAGRERLVDSAHDLAEGGLAQALVESCLHGDAGIHLVLPEDADPFVALFSESAGRAIVSVTRSQDTRFTDLCSARGLPHTRIGVVNLLDGQLDVQRHFAIPLRELRSVWSATIRQHFDS